MSLVSLYIPTENLGRPDFFYVFKLIFELVEIKHQKILIAKFRGFNENQEWPSGPIPIFSKNSATE